MPLDASFGGRGGGGDPEIQTDFTVMFNYGARGDHAAIVAQAKDVVAKVVQLFLGCGRFEVAQISEKDNNADCGTYYMYGFQCGGALSDAQMQDFNAGVDALAQRTGGMSCRMTDVQTGVVTNVVVMNLKPKISLGLS